MTIWWPPLMPGLLSSPSPNQREQERMNVNGEVHVRNRTQEKIKKMEDILNINTPLKSFNTADMDSLESSVHIRSKRPPLVCSVACCHTFVTFGDDLTPAGLIILLADVLIKQTIWKRTDKAYFNLLMYAPWEGNKCTLDSNYSNLYRDHEKECEITQNTIVNNFKGDVCEIFYPVPS